MRTISAALTFLAALLASPIVASSIVASAQRPTTEQEPVASGDTLEYPALHNLGISADGAWIAAEERPDRSDGNVLVWSTEGDVTFTIERGLNPRISSDSRWVSALQKPPMEDSRTAKPKNQRLGQTLVLLDLQDGSRRTFDFVLSYDLTYSCSHLAYLQSTEPTANERQLGTLHMVQLDDAAAEPLALQNVVQHASQGRDQHSDHFAYVVHDEETGRDTLYIATFNRPGSWGIRGTYSGEKIEGLCWARDPITLGFLDTTETTGKDGKRRVNSALYKWQPAPTDVERFTRVDVPQKK